MKNILNKKLVIKILKKFKPNFLVNFAAETHVDKSILNPILKDLSHEMSDIIKIVKVNVDEQESISKKFNV